MTARTKGTKKPAAIKLPKPWKPMGTAPKDGRAVLLLKKWRSNYECIVASWEFRELRDRDMGVRGAGAYWVGDGTIHVSGERSFVAWCPLPPMPPKTPWLKVGDRVITKEYCRQFETPQKGVVDMEAFPSEGGGWIYSVTLDSGEHAYLPEYHLTREGEDE